MEIYQFPNLVTPSAADIFPLSHNGNVYGIKYSDLAAYISGLTGAVRRGALAAADLDTITQDGIYALQGGVSYTNMPDGATYGALYVFTPYSSTQADIAQLLVSGSRQAWIRFYGATTWSAWASIVTKHDDATLTAYKGITLSAYNRGGIITLRGTSDGITEAMTTDSALETICTLPVGFRPAVTMTQYHVINATTRVQLIAYSSGLVQLGRARVQDGSSANLEAGTYVRFLFSFPEA